MRVALYWAPAVGDPLHELGSAWLGRDAETGATVTQPNVPGLQRVVLQHAVDAPAGYGLHATLRPPMALATGWTEFVGAAESLACENGSFTMPDLEIAEFGGFLALREAIPCAAMKQLADRCVEATELHRLKPGADELARRRAAGLSARQDALLQRWGYPYVMEEWRFHVTLTRRLSPDEMRVLRPAAERHFAPALVVSRLVDEICVFTQANSGSPFLIAERLKLAG